MGRLEYFAYTREESVANIKEDIRHLVWFKRLEREYRESRIGLNALDVIQNLRSSIYRDARNHRRDFGEFVNVKEYERTCK